jgi:polar amino acid transport system substrate-binding protein
MDMPATEYAVAFPKAAESEALMAQFNEFIRSETENGGLAELEAKWLSASEPDESIDFTQLTGENGTLHVATTVESKPFSYLKDGKYYGYDADFLFRFAKEYGYALRIDQIDFGALLPGLTAGRFDLAVSGITVTEERRETVLFSDAYYRSPIVMAVLADEPATGGEKTLTDFENATLGILSGSSFDPLAKERFPNAQRQYYSLVPDMILAVEQGKIDAYISETTYVAAAIWEGAKIETVDDVIDRTNAGYIFRKDSEGAAAVREQLNAFIIKSKESGFLQELQNKWLGSKEPSETFDNNSLTGENGTLKVAVSPDLKPLCYVKEGAVVGYEIEVLQHFAKEYGYRLEFVSMTFDAILPGVVSGKYDIGTGGMTITEERAQSVDFTESYLTVDVVMVVKASANSSAQGGFWAELKADFEKTFIRENRWKMIVEGVGVTMLISICAAVAGSLLGFGLYMLSRSDKKLLQMVAKGVAKVYSRIIAGTPVVVILMILFYVIFGKVRDMSGILVAIIGFTLTFGAFVYDHMTVSVGSVDRGQTEAAYALGYTKNKTFFRIIFPQAMTIFLPSYCGQAVELIKATAVVGYVAVNDLTKMGDIIRSNTYEAFFPLIATAVIYFLLTWILASLLKLLKLRFEPKRRRKEDILKGVKTV